VTKEQKHKKLNYLKLKELLIGLGMMTEDAANNDSKERVLLYDMWKLIRGEQKEEVHLEDVKIVIMVALRLTEHKRIGIQGFSEDEIGFINSKD
jgi:hypothetical protein